MLNHVSLSNFTRHANALMAAAALCGAPALAQAQSGTVVSEIAAYEVVAPRVAIEEPAVTFAMPVSLLRYEPQVDLQARNSGEAQGDVAIRGGTFKDTGFRLGAATLHDPQTGHYFAEIPVPTAMLSAPQVLTGADNAVQGFNSNVGTLQYDWQPVVNSGELSASAGTEDYNAQHGYAGYVVDASEAGLEGLTEHIAFDLDAARSEGDATVDLGFHEYERYAARLQLQHIGAQTDVFAGYQTKFFGWEKLYSPGSRVETENLQTNIFILNHRNDYAHGSFFEATGYYRRHKDEYIFNSPAVFRANHKSIVRSGGLKGRHEYSEQWALNYAGQFTDDGMSSTSLGGGALSREYVKLAATPEWTYRVDEHNRWIVTAGAAYDAASRSGSAVSPIARANYVEELANGENSYYAEYAESSQVPGYTALNSAAAGLFGGNRSLSREKTHNHELGVKVRRERWSAQAAVFYRKDNKLVDWTFNTTAPNARQANPVNIDTYGFEAIAQWRGDAIDLTAGYTHLNKDEDYGSAAVNASFYALNFPEHRWTGALVWRPLNQVEVRSDNEYRIQEKNTLRTSERDAFLSSLRVNWYPNVEQLDGLELHLAVDNVFNTQFQEVPAVPGAGRQLSGGATWRW